MVANKIAPRLTHRRAAYTLMEVVIAISISTIIGVAVMTTLIFMGRSLDGMSNYVDLDRRSRNALDIMMSEVRQCSRLASFKTNQIILQKPDASTVEFFHDDSEQTLSRIADGETNVLLTGCEKLLFGIYRRNPTTNGDFTQYEATADPALCKVIQVNWTCYRKAFATNVVNSESVQTAKIVMRNKL